MLDPLIQCVGTLPTHDKSGPCRERARWIVHIGPVLHGAPQLSGNCCSQCFAFTIAYNGIVGDRESKLSKTPVWSWNEIKSQNGDRPPKADEAMDVARRGEM